MAPEAGGPGQEAGEERPHGVLTRALAFACQMCPFCVAARAFPESAYARTMRRIERNCPACNAWVRVHGPPSPPGPAPKP